MRSEDERINNRFIQMALDGEYCGVKYYLSVPNVLRKCIRLDGSEKEVLYQLLYSMNDKSFCWPSHDTLANEIGISEKTVRRHIQKLEDMYFIKKQSRVGTSNLYHLDKLEDNPYLQLTGCTDYFKKKFSTDISHEHYYKSKVHKSANDFFKSHECEIFAERLYKGENTNDVLNDYLETLRKYVGNKYQINIMPIKMPETKGKSKPKLPF